jgi:hypothetical protein
VTPNNPLPPPATQPLTTRVTRATRATLTPSTPNSCHIPKVSRLPYFAIRTPAYVLPSLSHFHPLPHPPTSLPTPRPFRLLCVLPLLACIIQSIVSLGGIPPLPPPLYYYNGPSFLSYEIASGAILFLLCFYC